MKKLLALIMAMSLVTLAGCAAAGATGVGGQGTVEAEKATEEVAAAEQDAVENDAVTDVLTPGKAYTVDHKIAFTGNGVTFDGAAVKEYDYTWNVDIDGDYDQVKNAPAEYYTGTKPDGTEAVYVAHDIFYYPQIDAEKFQKLNYDGETEWCVYYGNEKYKDYLFGTLPVEGTEVPARMMHTAEEAAKNAKLHITAPGTYELSGTWQGQVWVDLGEESFTDPEAVVTLVLNDANITCTVAPAIVFYQVYEADNTWEEREMYSDEVDISAAGANVIVADDTRNTVSGANVYRMLKTKYKDEDSTDAVKVQKKQRKTDGALYSYMSMNVDGGPQGTGLLEVESTFEGVDTELHLAFNSGCVKIVADNDGVNVNEDHVSVVQFNGASVSVIAGLGFEGDGVDSNGFATINGGTLYSVCNPAADSGIDAEDGYRVTGGTLFALGSSMDVGGYSEETSQPLLALKFNGRLDGKEWLCVRTESGDDVIGFCQMEHEDFCGNERSYGGAVISSPKLTVGETYKLYYGEKLLGYTGSTTESRIMGQPGGERPEGMGSRGQGGETSEGGQPGGMNIVGDPRKDGEIPAGGQPQGGMPDMQPEIMPDPNGAPEDPDIMIAAEAKEGAIRPERPESAGQPGGMAQPPEMPAGEGSAQPGEMPQMPEDGFGTGGAAGRGGFGFGGDFGRGGAQSSEIYTKFTLEKPATCFSGIMAINL